MGELFSGANVAPAISEKSPTMGWPATSGFVTDTPDAHTTEFTVRSQRFSLGRQQVREMESIDDG